MKRLVCVTLTGALLSVSQLAVAAPPAWVDGRDSRYSSETYLVGVGHGPNRDSADLDARAEVARIFESHVASVLKDYQAAATKVNSSGKTSSIEVQAVAQFQQVFASKTLSGVEIRERGEDAGTYYALALLGRKPCIHALREQIESLDAKIKGSVAAAETSDKVKAFKHYGQALGLLDERDGLNAMLRVCDRSGEGVAAPVSMDDLVSKFDEAATGFRLGVVVEGNGAERVRDCILEELGNKGYQVTEVAIKDSEAEDGEWDDDEEWDEEGKDDEPEFDAILKGKLKSERAGEVAGSVMVRTQLTMKLINPKTNKVLKAFSESRKEGRRDVRSSAALAAHKICQKNVKQMVQTIDKYFKR